MKSFQALRSPAISLTSFHDLPVLLISSSIVLRHVLFGLPLLLDPWGFESNALFSIASASLCDVCPIQFRFLLFVYISIGFCLVILHNSSFVILSIHFMFIIRLKHLFINVCSLFVIWLVVLYLMVHSSISPRALGSSQKNPLSLRQFSFGIIAENRLRDPCI